MLGHTSEHHISHMTIVFLLISMGQPNRRIIDLKNDIFTRLLVVHSVQREDVESTPHFGALIHPPFVLRRHFGVGVHTLIAHIPFPIRGDAFERAVVRSDLLNAQVVVPLNERLGRAVVGVPAGREDCCEEKTC